jgi:hypothetical protein
MSDNYLSDLSGFDKWECQCEFGIYRYWLGSGDMGGLMFIPNSMKYGVKDIVVDGFDKCGDEEYLIDTANEHYHKLQSIHSKFPKVKV